MPFTVRQQSSMTDMKTIVFRENLSLNIYAEGDIFLIEILHSEWHKMLSCLIR